MPVFCQEMVLSTLGELWSCASLVCVEEWGKVRKKKVWLEYLQLLKHLRDSEVDNFKMLCFILVMYV